LTLIPPFKRGRSVFAPLRDKGGSSFSLQSSAFSLFFSPWRAWRAWR